MLQNIAPTLIASTLCLAIFLLAATKNSRNLKAILLTGFYQFIYAFMVFLPIAYESMFISGSTMNWTGKLFAIMFSVCFYFLFRKQFETFDFVSQKPEKDALKKVLLVGGITLFSMCLLTVAFSNGKALNLERLFYQAIIPGIDEELWRGISLGLLLPLAKHGKYKMGHPALWVVTIIFAFGHAFYFHNWESQFLPDVFVLTGILGFILGWMILRSRSILLAMIFHNLINLSTNMLEMTFLNP